MTRRRLSADDLPPAAEKPTEALRCPVHHCLLERGLGPQGSRAWCPEGNAFSTMAPCPFACPICRQPLDWSGGCKSCHGTYSGGRRQWTFPGDRYDRFDDEGKPISDGMHWHKVDGPRPACTPEENIENMKTLRLVLARMGVKR